MNHEMHNVYTNDPLPEVYRPLFREERCFEGNPFALMGPQGVLLHWSYRHPGKPVDW